MASFLKQLINVPDDDRGELNFNRAHIDGMPYRGKATPLLREEEFDEYLDTVQDAGAEKFDMDNPLHAKAYAKIIENSVNGWFVILKRDHHWVDQTDGTARLYVYCEWSKPHKELAVNRLPSRIQEMLGNPQGTQP